MTNEQRHVVCRAREAGWLLAKIYLAASLFYGTVFGMIHWLIT
jgi:hypothetical protein